VPDVTCYVSVSTRRLARCTAPRRACSEGCSQGTLRAMPARRGSTCVSLAAECCSISFRPGKCAAGLACVQTGVRAAATLTVLLGDHAKTECAASMCSSNTVSACSFDSDCLSRGPARRQRARRSRAAPLQTKPPPARAWVRTRTSLHVTKKHLVRRSDVTPTASCLVRPACTARAPSPTRTPAPRDGGTTTRRSRTTCRAARADSRARASATRGVQEPLTRYVGVFITVPVPHCSFFLLRPWCEEP